MKKLVSVLMIAFLTLGFVACGDSGCDGDCRGKVHSKGRGR